MGYRCAILGCGARAEGHAAAYRLISRGSLVACCDVDRDRLAAFADRHGIAERYTDLDEMLERARPDVVHVVTKPTIRVSIMSRLADARTPAAIVEKPICIGGDDYAALRDIERRGCTKFAVNHQLRHHPRVLEFLGHVANGKVGEVKMLDASCGLPLAGQGVHILDLMFAFAGYAEVDKVFGVASGYDDIDGTHPSPRTTAAIVTFRNGTRGVLQAGEGYPVFEPDERPWAHKRIAVCGTRGYLHWRFSGWETSLPGEPDASGPSDYGAEDLPGQAGLTEAVFDWLADDARIAPTDLRTSLNEWLVILAIYQSVIEARPVTMPFDPPADLLDRYRRFVTEG